MQEAAAFIDESRNFLTEHFLPKIKHCLECLTDEQIWRRANENSNSVGNLVLHLSGNVRQWIISGLGGALDVRERQKEFDQRAGVSKDELLGKLRATVAEAAEVLSRFDSSTLLQSRTIQGQTVTNLYAIYHVVEHFSMHTGQIILLTKMLTGDDLIFYQMVGDKPVHNW